MTQEQKDNDRKKGSGIRVSKVCPQCDWRVLDKVTPTTGVIAIKCPRCKKVVYIDLSLRRVVSRL